MYQYCISTVYCIPADENACYLQTHCNTNYLAVGSTVSHGAGAAVSAQPVSAGSSVLTGLGLALVVFILTEFPIKTRTATARKTSDAINARPIVQTGAGRNEKTSTDQPDYLQTAKWQEILS